MLFIFSYCQQPWTALLIHESGFTALSSRAGKGDSFGAWFNPVYLLTVLTGTISTQQADSFPARALGCLESLSTSPLLWTPGRGVGRGSGRRALSTILLTLLSRPLKVYGPQAAHPDGLQQLSLPERKLPSLGLPPEKPDSFLVLALAHSFLALPVTVKGAASFERSPSPMQLPPCRTSLRGG